MEKFEKIFEKVSDTVVKAAEVTARKTSEVAEVSKLKIEISRSRDEIKKAYSEIGKLYFEECGPEGGQGIYAELFDKINKANIDIAKNKARIKDIKKPEIDADFEDEATADETENQENDFEDEE